MANPSRNNLTIKRLAEICKVSVGTVSAVINNRDTVKPETAERVRQVMKDVGYQANPWAKKMQQSKTRMLALIAPFDNSLYCDANIRLLTRRFRDMGYSCMVQYLNEDEVLDPTRYPVDGFILLFAGYPKLREVLEQQAIPFVFFDAFRDLETTASLFVMDRQEGGRLAAKRLYDAGHRQFAFVSGAKDLKCQGFCQEVVRLGCPNPLVVGTVQAFLDSPGLPKDLGIMAGGMVSAFDFPVVCQELQWEVGRDCSFLYWGNTTDEIPAMKNYSAVGLPDPSLCRQMLDALDSEYKSKGVTMVIPVLEERSSIRS